MRSSRVPENLKGENSFLLERPSHQAIDGLPCGNSFVEHRDHGPGDRGLDARGRGDLRHRQAGTHTLGHGDVGQDLGQANRLGFRAEMRYATRREAVEQVIVLCEEIRKQPARSSTWASSSSRTIASTTASCTKRPRARFSGGACNSRACRRSFSRSVSWSRRAG